MTIDKAANGTASDIKDAIKDMGFVPDDEHLWVDVVEEGDDSFRIIAIQTEGVTDCLSDLLDDCLS